MYALKHGRRHLPTFVIGLCKRVIEALHDVLPKFAQLIFSYVLFDMPDIVFVAGLCVFRPLCAVHGKPCIKPRGKRLLFSVYINTVC
jgi:hypothetical protein